MQCTLYIPHLIPPPDMGKALWRTVDAPSLKMLLARAAFTCNNETDADGLLCRTFGVAQQRDWPLAPLLAHRENLATEGDYWLCATPIHLETRRNALVLSDPSTLDMTPAASGVFAATLAAHLREENIMLHAPAPGLWLLRCDTPPAITTTSLGNAAGHDVRPFLPKGPDSPRWHRMLTELQMLLHAHPTNEARETRGLMPVNSVWLWGGGVLPPRSQQSQQVTAPFGIVWSNDIYTRALAWYAGCHVAQVPAGIRVSDLKDEAHFFAVDTLASCIRRGDAQSWRDTVNALNRDWFHPLREALKSRQLDRLSVISSNGTGTQRFEIRPRDIIKFWRKNKYLQ